MAMWPLGASCNVAQGNEAQFQAKTERIAPLRLSVQAVFASVAPPFVRNQRQRIFGEGIGVTTAIWLLL